jgi:hypothetical protein
MLTTHIHLVPRLRMSGAAPVLLLYAVMPAQGQHYLYLYLYQNPEFLIRENISVLYFSSFSDLVVHHLPEQRIYRSITHMTEMLLLVR